MELILRSAEISIPNAIENLEQLKAEIIPKMEYYRSLVVTESSIRSAKNDRANLNKLKKAINDQRIAVKKQCLAPYEALERECKELEALIIAPMSAIDVQIKAFEEIEKNQKYSELQAFFDNADHVDFIVLDDVLNPKWSNKTLSIDVLKEEISANISRISGEYEQLRKMYQNSPLLTPIINKFIEKKELSLVLVYASQLESDLTREQKRKAEQESKAAMIQQKQEQIAQAENPENATASDSGKNNEIIPPGIQNGNTSESEQPEPTLKGKFSVECTKSQLISLRDFMKSQGIKYELIK